MTWSVLKQHLNFLNIIIIIIIFMRYICKIKMGPWQGHFSDALFYKNRQKQII